MNQEVHLDMKRDSSVAKHKSFNVCAVAMDSRAVVSEYWGAILLPFYRRSGRDGLHEQEGAAL